MSFPKRFFRDPRQVMWVSFCSVLLDLIVIAVAWFFRGPATRGDRLELSLLTVLSAHFTLGVLAWCMSVGRGHQKKIVSVAPGWTLLHALGWLYSPKTVAQVFEPAISDLQHEHIEALAAGCAWKARWVLVRGYFSVWSAAVAQAPLSLMKRLYELWKAAS